MSPVIRSTVSEGSGRDLDAWSCAINLTNFGGCAAHKLLDVTVVADAGIGLAGQQGGDQRSAEQGDPPRVPRRTAHRSLRGIDQQVAEGRKTVFDEVSVKIR